jgi:addiction module HigA family antidote
MYWNFQTIINKNIMITLKGVDPRMIANNLEPSEPIHPGEILKEEIECRGLSQKKLAERMGMSYTVLNEILNCKRAVTTEYALLFEAALEIDAEPLVGIQTDYNLQTAKRNKSFAQRLANIRKAVAML